MELTTRTLPARKHIALVAHDHCKDLLMKWVERHQALLAQHQLYATGTTGNPGLTRHRAGSESDAERTDGRRPAGRRADFGREKLMY